MKRQKITIQALLKKLASQSGEDKLRIAFKLSSFVKKLRLAGIAYGQKQHRTGTTA